MKSKTYLRGTRIFYRVLKYKKLISLKFEGFELILVKPMALHIDWCLSVLFVENVTVVECKDRSVPFSTDKKGRRRANQKAYTFSS